MIRKNFISIFGLLYLIIITSCNSNNKVERPIKIAKQVSEKQTITQSQHYSFYAPDNLDKVEGILLILDPHSNPYLVMDSLHDFADSNNLVLVGLNEIRNGIKDYEAIISRDIEHIKRFKKLHNPKLYFLGFSGGARMSEYYAGVHRIDGLIMCGAGIKRQSKLPFPTVQMAGTQDFNFREQYYNQNSPKVYDANSIAIHFRGKHTWPQIKYIEYAIKFIISRQKGGDDKLAKYFERSSQLHYKDKKYYLCFKEMEAAYKISSFEKRKERKILLQKLARNSRIKNYFRRSDLYLEEEAIRFQTYSNSIDIKDINWWNNEIRYIVNKSKKKDKILADSYGRTIAFLGIAMYSKLSQAISGRGNTQLIPKYLELYEIIEPNNSDLYFFKAVYQYTSGSEQQAVMDIRKAKKLGFVDEEKMSVYFSQDFINSI